MGSRSKGLKEERGAHGSKKFIRQVTLKRGEDGVEKPTFHIVGVTRPNRGRRRGVIKLVSKGRRPLNINAMRVSNTPAKKEQKPTAFGKIKRFFQRKGE